MHLRGRRIVAIRGDPAKSSPGPIAQRIAVAHTMAGVAPDAALDGSLLVLSECLLAPIATLLPSTWFSRLSSDVIVIRLYGARIQWAGSSNK
jgi:hypothetical protein